MRASMKRYLPITCLSAIFLFLSVVASLGVPNLISYQGVLNDKNGVPMSTTVTMTFTIYDASTEGNAVWNESQTVTVESGLFNVQLGSVQQLPSTVFASDAVYLGIQVGADDEMVPRQQITSSAYSFVSDQVNEQFVPIGSIIAWTPGSRIFSNRTATIGTGGLLEDSGVDFITSNVKAEMQVGDMYIQWPADDYLVFDPAPTYPEFVLMGEINLAEAGTNGVPVNQVRQYMRTDCYYKVIFNYTSQAPEEIIFSSSERDWYSVDNPFPNEVVTSVQVFLAAIPGGNPIRG